MMCNTLSIWNSFIATSTTAIGWLSASLSLPWYIPIYRCVCVCVQYSLVIVYFFLGSICVVFIQSNADYSRTIVSIKYEDKFRSLIFQIEMPKFALKINLNIACDGSTELHFRHDPNCIEMS